jgi:putative MATE family efflux protein
MGTGGVVATLLRMAVPAAIAGLLATTFQMVDMLFIGWLGKDQVTGVGFAFPVIFFTFAIGQAAGVGVSVLVGRHLGAGHEHDARRSLEQALLISACVGGVISVVSQVATGPVLSLLGAPDAVAPYGVAYLSQILLGCLVFHLGLVADAGLRAQGNTLTGMRVALLGNAINLVLDGFFIFGPTNRITAMPDWPGLRQLGDLYEQYGLDLGVRGGAAITVICQCLVVVLLLRSLWSHQSHVRPFVHSDAPWRFRWDVIKRIYAMGLPATVSILGMSFSGMLVNGILTGLVDPDTGAEIGVTAVGAFMVASRLEMFAFSPIFSLGSALVPMVSYNVGARNIRRCRETIVKACLLAGSAMAAVGVVLFLFPRQFMTLFNSDPGMVSLGTEYLRINTLSYFIIGCDVMLSNGLQGLGRPDLSMVTQLIRAVLVKVPVALGLSLVLGVTGVWLSSPISTAACCVFATTVTWRLFRRSLRGAHAPAEAVVVTDLPPEA